MTIDTIYDVNDRILFYSEDLDANLRGTIEEIQFTANKDGHGCCFVIDADVEIKSSKQHIIYDHHIIKKL